jgi:hypothetical protein
MCGDVPTPPEPKLIFLGNIFRRKVQVRIQHIGELHGAGDRRAVVHEIERDVFVERGIDGVVRRDEADGVAIGRLREHVLHADIAAGAGAILDHERLAELLRQILPEEARDRVVRPTGRKRNNEVDRPRRIIDRQTGCAQHQQH